MINFVSKNRSNLAKSLAVGAIIATMVLAEFLIFSPVMASNAEALKVTRIDVTTTDRSATISWITNKPASGLFEYGANSGNYEKSYAVTDRKTNHSMTVLGVLPDTTYYFRVTAYDNEATISSFERTFATGETFANKAPTISGVRVAYTTGRTATIQWFTDEPATSVVEYGRTESLGASKGGGSKTIAHDITLSNLVPGAIYHYRVSSTDSDHNNISWTTKSFRTLPVETSDNEEFRIYNIRPTSENNLNVSVTSVLISWRTNKLSSGVVRYGTTPDFSKSIATEAPRSFGPSVTITGILPGTTYYFEIEGRDIFGQKKTTETHSFTTRGLELEDLPGDGFTGGRVLGDRLDYSDSNNMSCDTSLLNQTGYLGFYYNLSGDRADMKLGSASRPSHIKVATENDWYELKHFSFDRVDQQLRFGSNFLPVNDGLIGDPYHFAVYWRAMVEVPANGSYSFRLNSDDDAWIFVDGQLVADLGGMYHWHGQKTINGSINLSTGFHLVEIYYAERGRSGAAFTFDPDSRLTFRPLPWGCGVSQAVGNTKVGQVIASATPVDSGGQVLGTKITASDQYVCNPDRGYTQFDKLYKISGNPAVWAILETGQRHLISSPRAFRAYGCDWSEIEYVSKDVIDSYPKALMVKEKDSISQTIYRIYQVDDRPTYKTEIVSTDIFNSYQDASWDKVARVNDLDIDIYQKAAVVKTSTGDKVYLLANGQKYMFKDGEALYGRGYGWKDVVVVSQTYLDTFSDGEIIE